MMAIAAAAVMAMMILRRMRRRRCSLSENEGAGAGSVMTASIRCLKRLREHRLPKTMKMIQFHLAPAFGGC